MSLMECEQHNNINNVLLVIPLQLAIRKQYSFVHNTRQYSEIYQLLYYSISQSCFYEYILIQMDLQSNAYTFCFCIIELFSDSKFKISKYIIILQISIIWYLYVHSTITFFIFLVLVASGYEKFNYKKEHPVKISNQVN